MREYDIRLDSDFRNDFGAESFEIAKLVMALEAEFGVEIADSDTEQIETVRQVIDYLGKAVPT